MNINIRLTKIEYEMLKELQKRDKKGLEEKVKSNLLANYKRIWYKKSLNKQLEVCYTENEYLENPRIVNDEYRRRLQSFQVPAIQKYFGSLQGKFFADIGCGDMPLAYCQEEIGRPSKYFATDLSVEAIYSGLNSLHRSGIDTSNIVPISGPYFDFDLIPDSSLDAAFSNSLFSHLSLNTILICLKNLSPKMAPHARYLSSMIILPEGIDSLQYEWKMKHGANSHAAKDPFHYEFLEFRKIVDSCTGFTCRTFYQYGHPFQVLVEFIPDL